MFASLRALLIVVALALAPLALLIPAAAATTLPAGPLALRRAASPLPLEPSLADTRWADALTDGRFTNLATRAAAAGTTRVAFFYDDRAIYVGVQAEQTAPVVASQPADEIGFGTDDFVGFEIDTAGNGERVYLFAVTPRGTRYAFARESTRYKPEWGAAAASTATGWNAVMRIPYGALKLAGDGFQHWKINLVRNVAATAEHDTLVYTPLMADATVPTFPNYAFDWRFWPPVDGVALRGAVPRPKPRAEVYGLESAGTDRDAVVTPAGTTVRRAPRAGGGATSSFRSIRPRVFVGAFSPDFSNVEIDQLTIAPQQFQRALTEYWPFFAQGAAYVNAALEVYQPNLPPEVLFYSPNIAAFDRGFKVVGSKGTTSFGALEVRGSDPQTGAAFDDLAFGIHQRRPSNTFAWWADGAFAGRENGVDRSYEVGAFGRSLASGLVYSAMHAQETGPTVTRPSEAQKNAAFIDLQKPGMEANLGSLDTGPQFAPVAGFTNLADVRGPYFSLDLNRSPKRGAIKFADLYLNFDRWRDRRNNVHDADADAYLTLKMRSPLAFYLNDQLGSLRTYEGDGFSGGPHGYRDAQVLPFKTWSIGAGYGEGPPSSFRTDWQQGPFGAFFRSSARRR